MVVIIDDRGDVWQWESNLIKVVPYDFFVGIGDINSSFLPKKNGQLTGPTKKRKSIAKLEAAAELAKESDTNNDKQETESGKKRVKKMLMVTRTCQTPLLKESLNSEEVKETLVYCWNNH